MIPMYYIGLRMDNDIFRLYVIFPGLWLVVSYNGTLLVVLDTHIQSGRSPKVVALFSATKFSSYIIELLQLHDTIQIEWNYACIHYSIAIRSHLMI